MDYLLTFDVGTTSVKTCVFDADINLIAKHTSEYKLDTKSDGTVEVPGEVYWQKLILSTKDIALKLGREFENITAVAITTQGETLIPVDAGGETLGNAVIWLDGRAAAQADRINRILSADDIYRKTGLPEINGMTPVSKILWFKENKPETYTKTYKFMLLEDYLIMKLTGEFVSEKSLMSSTGYFDIVSGCLWEEVLDKLDIDKSKIPEALECGSCAGKVTAEASRQTGIKQGVNVYTTAMDQVTSSIGSGNIRSGSSKVTQTMGTAMVLGVVADDFDPDKLKGITVYRHALKDKFFILPYCETAGILLKWFKDEFCGDISRKAESEGISAYKLMDEMSGSVAPGSEGVVCFPHFMGASAPVDAPHAKGMFSGISLNTTRGHFIRAIQEGIAYMLKQQLDLLAGAGITADTVICIGGGAQSEVLCQIEADVTNYEVETLEMGETASLGAALLAAEAAGIIKLDDWAGRQTVKGKYVPQERSVKIYEERYKAYIRLCDSAKGLYR